MTETAGAASASTASESSSLVLQSKDKLQAVAETLKPWIIISNDDHDDNYERSKTAKNSSYCNNNMLPHVLTCEQQEAYRCKCSFQLLLLQHGENVRWRYAIRRSKQPIIIDAFPIANHLIQKAMHHLLNELNNNNIISSSSRNNNVITQHLTSVSFSSPWQDDDNDINSHNSISRIIRSVVVVTLHYNGPITDEISWQEQARSICQTCGLAQLTGRSKKVMVRAFHEVEVELESNDTREVPPRSPSSINDTLWLEKQTNKDETHSSSTWWNVTFLNHNKPDDIKASHFTKDDDTLKIRSSIPVHYCKPEGAFFHPNASVMMLALKWLLNRVQYIATTTVTTNATSTTTTVTNAHAATTLQKRRPRLLELYCGCGAHTMPLAMSRLLSHITALELDERLVRALKHNCRLNNLVTVPPVDNDDHDKSDTGAITNSCQPSDGGGCATTVVECISSDAGTWAREQQQRHLKKRQRQDNNDNDYSYSCNDLDWEYDILLVDPPRNGLDEQVCQLALQQNDNYSTAGESSSPMAAFSHILYISCGKEALVRDLERLSAGYELVDCALLDLFPQTDAVETLVHLQRRRRQEPITANTER